MTFSNDQEAIDFIKASQTATTFFTAARKQSKELFSLVEGDGFLEELITRIEHLESEEKAKARKKYSRSIKDFYERLLQPINNVFSATGGSVKYDLSPEQQSTLLDHISKIRDEKSIQKWVENMWMPLYHTDPNGVVFMEYKVDGDTNKTWPTYKSINSIRNYVLKGQMLDVILFEPKQLEDGKQLWRIVDDVMDRFFIQKGETFTLSKELSFKHPFGTVPGFAISDLIKLGTRLRISPIYKITELTKEYARDQSFKSLYKFLHGNPIQWRYFTQCKKCAGVGKTGGSVCSDCSGKGELRKNDVTDQVKLEVPTKDQQMITPEIAGFISPDIETWTQYNNELEILEGYAHKTHWGSIFTFESTSGGKTATEVVVSNIQPIINKLNMYADSAEWVEKQITELTANFLFPVKTKEKNIAQISYGRRYIIESPDAILEQYNKSKEKGDNNVILDRLFNEYLTAKYKNDLEWLRTHLLKAEIEPYLHESVEQINDIFGQIESQRKILFGKWWGTLEQKDFQKDSKVLKSEFDTWFDENKIESTQPVQPSNQLN